MAPSLWRLEDGTLHLDFHAGQARAWQSRQRFIAVLAGTQGGKTSFGPWWLWREIRARGGGDHLAITATFDLFKLKMLPALREVFEHVLGWGRYWSGDRVLELADPATGRFLARRADDPMWGRIILRSAESGSGLESATARSAWLDEAGMDAFTLATWEAIRRRLSLAQGRALFTTTLYNLGWLKQQIYDPWRRHDPAIAVIQFDSILNPTFPRAEFDEMQGKLPRWKFNMFYRGRYERPAGLIYDCFDESKHQIARFAIPPAWPRYLGLDFGGVHTAGLFLAEEPGHPAGQERWFAYREYQAGGRTAAEHIYYLLEGEPGVPRGWGGSKSEGQWRAEFAQGGTVRGVPVPGLPLAAPDVPDVEVGINRVYAAHQSGRYQAFADLAGYLDEKLTYSRKLDSAGEPTEEIDDKSRFHLLDAERYVVGPLMNRSMGIFF